MTAGRPVSHLAFERLEIRRLPGFERQGFELRDLSPGVNLIHGPQAAGKTTAGRVVASLLWPDDGAGIGSWAAASVAATARLDGRRWEIDAAHARPRYQEEGAPREGLPVPGGELADRYSLALHDLLQTGTDDASFARLIARELAGGFDLDEALRAAGARERPGRPKGRLDAWEKADRAVRAAEAEQARLAAEAAELARLRAEEEAGRAAAGELDEVRAVLAQRSSRRRLAEAERALAEGFPAAMERVEGSDLETLEALEGRLAGAQAEIERARGGIGHSEARLRAAALPEEGVPPAALAALEEEQARLRELEARLEEAATGLAGLRRRREEARGALGPLESAASGSSAEDTLRALSREDWQPLLDLAARAERLRGERARLEDVEAWLGRAEPPADQEQLAEGVRLLRRWLRAPGAARRLGLAALLAAASLAALGAWGGLALDPRLWAAAGLGAAFGLWAGFELARGRSERRAAAREYAALGLAPPPGWRTGAVERRLRDLEPRLARAQVAAEKAVRWGDLEPRRARLGEQAAELGRRRDDLLASLGIAPEVAVGPGGSALAEAPLAAFAQALCAWRAADLEVRAREAEIDARTAERRRRLAAAGETLAPFGFDPPADAAALHGSLAELQGRERERLEARRALDELAGEAGVLARAERAVAELLAERERFFRDRGLEPGDRAGLARLVALLPAWSEHSDREREARWALTRAEVALPGREDLVAREDRDLEALHDTLAERSGRVEGLVAEIRVLEDRVRRAKASHDLEEALARREEAREALRAERERDADAAVADELGRWLRESLRGRRRPAVMQRAAEHFAGFTRGRYRLLDPEHEPPALRALETASDHGRSLAELSSGTRLQLLLAVRIAYLEDREHGVRLPLVLDETLANADEWSSRAIIDAVVELAREGRQIFYLTAQDDEIAKWRAALEATADGPDWKVIDLAEVRRLEEKAAAPRTGWRPEAPAVPAPEGRSREEYARVLAVPGIDPRAAAGRVHLWHLVEEVEVLHRLLVRGVESWGQAEVLAEDGGAPELLGSGEEGEQRWRRIRARGRCLEVLCRGWRQGRGRPVDRAALVASGAVSEAFIDEVSDLAEELEGSATALLAALRDRRVKGFHRSKMEELEAHLQAEGYLDDREPLDPPALGEAARRDLAAELEAGHLTPQEIDELAARLPPGARAWFYANGASG